jgi:hypothetical protein
MENIGTHYNDGVITMLQHVPWAIVLVAASVVVSALEGEAWMTRKQRLPKQYTSRSAQTSRRGRPRKFGRPSRAVTLTLPEDVLAKLQAIDRDLSCAVVRAMETENGQEPRSRAELTTYGNRAVILVPRSRVLRERTGVELVPTADGRALISMDDRLSVPQLELRLHDALRDPVLDDNDRALFEALVEILRNARQDDGVELRQQQIIVLQRRRAAGRA